ncbi:hypothetical protein NLJ89_g8142 [Agrocybe chaxingu]|uniref:Uncharacterized protein n=1 Tax=Agrocybe chaxingu TaxID=84603 RepID=A0A9W8K2B4_9AGAR|nr:hypothetical protein NLJ89_g8142 [Agrocybe chaxingu]
MAELSKELPSGVIEQTKIQTLDSAILDVVAKVSASEPSIYQAEICSRRSESYLSYSLQPNAFATLENSIALGSVAVKYVQKDDPNRGIVISMFARTLRRRWQLRKDEDDYLDQAIYYFQKTIELEPVDTPNRPLHFDDLGCSHRDRYLRRRKPEDFDAAKLAFESAASIPHSGEPMFLSNLGNC